jgi:hypothetical protein
MTDLANATLQAAAAQNVNPWERWHFLDYN